MLKAEEKKTRTTTPEMTKFKYGFAVKESFIFEEQITSRTNKLSK